MALAYTLLLRMHPHPYPHTHKPPKVLAHDTHSALNLSPLSVPTPPPLRDPHSKTHSPHNHLKNLPCSAKTPKGMVAGRSHSCPTIAYTNDHMTIEGGSRYADHRILKAALSIPTPAGKQRKYQTVAISVSPQYYPSARVHIIIATNIFFAPSRISGRLALQRPLSSRV